MCLNNNDHLANTLKWTPWKWTHSVFICVLVLSSTSGVELEFPPERDELVAKDSNMLLNPKFLPFLNDCTSSAPSNLVPCAIYYDMVYNVYEMENAKVTDVQAEIRTANQTLEKMGESFCKLFPTEITQALDKRPFLQANHIDLTALFRLKDYCTMICLTVQVEPVQEVVKPICKSISGGCRWIIKQKTHGGIIDIESKPAVAKTIESPKAKLEEKPSVNDSNIINMLSVNSKPNEKDASNKQDAVSTNEKVENVAVSEIAKTNAKSIEQLIISPNLNSSSSQNSNPIPNLNTNINSDSNLISPNPSPKMKPDALNVSKPVEPLLTQQAAQKDEKDSIVLSASKVTENRPSTASLNKPSQSKDTFTEQRDDNANELNINQNENIADENDMDDADKQEDDTEPEDLADDIHEDERNHEQEVRNDLKNSNNMQSPLLADAAEFREDKESSFFPYFMFLMFIVITLYVSYHNKTKILALLIEGRRSRSYSRGGRRKQHSAEYRKLDSNLEEAIQSDGSHMTSSQIIY